VVLKKLKREIIFEKSIKKYLIRDPFIDKEIDKYNEDSISYSVSN